LLHFPLSDGEKKSNGIRKERGGKGGKKKISISVYVWDTGKIGGNSKKRETGRGSRFRLLSLSRKEEKKEKWKKGATRSAMKKEEGKGRSVNLNHGQEKKGTDNVEEEKRKKYPPFFPFRPTVGGKKD